MSPLQTILQILAEGPAKTAEIAAEMGTPLTITSARLFSAWRSGHLGKAPFPPTSGGPPVMLWTLAKDAKKWGAKTRDVDRK